MPSADSIPASPTVTVETDGAVTVVTIDRPSRRNAVDRPTANALCDAFVAFDQDDDQSVAVLRGAGTTFCAGADLQAMGTSDGNHIDSDMAGRGPMGPTRLRLSKPVIAAVEGYAVAGGLELALWCDLRVAASDATFGVFCRRWGVPLIDGGTVRLPRIIGEGRAMDMILSGRAVGAAEALAMGLVNRIIEPGSAVDAAVEWAHTLAALPQRCMRNDRASLLYQWGLSDRAALAVEFAAGIDSLADPDLFAQIGRFVDGAGRGGT